MFATGSTEALQSGIVTDQIRGQPLPDLRPELLDIHSCRLTYQALALLAPGGRGPATESGGHRNRRSTTMTGHLTTPAVLDRVACDFADHEAMVTADRRLSFAELREEVRRTAAAIAGAGVRPGDRVALWSPNTWHWVVTCLAVQYAGGVVVPINTRYTAEEAADIIGRTAAPLLIAMGRFLGADRAASAKRANASAGRPAATSARA
jgi:non-ribosomal peptide synthetase component F